MFGWSRRYELLYSERWANESAGRQWSLEDYLVSDFFMFSLNEFVTAMRMSPRRLVEQAAADALAKDEHQSSQSTVAVYKVWPFAVETVATSARGSQLLRREKC